MQTSPAIILVNPQLVENIGMAARAMMNCGLTDLRLVSPRDPWPLGETHRQRMLAASSGADSILNGAKLYTSVEEAIADLHYVYATTGRTQDMANRIVTGKTAASEMVAMTIQEQKVGVLFGPERTGLQSDHIALANARVTIPLNPEFASLNLAQAVLLIGYEWYQANDKTAPDYLNVGKSRLATKEEYELFFGRLEKELDARGFFVARDMRPTMVRSLRTMLQRATMTEQEVRTWQGVLSALIRQPYPRDSIE